MDDLEEAIDLGPENDQHLRRLRRALILGTGFQLVFVEVSHPNLKQEVLRRLRLWSGNDGVPALALVRTRPRFDPAIALQDVASGAVLTGIDEPFDVAAIEQAMTTLNWYRDQLPQLVSGPLVLILSPDGLRQLFVHAPDLFASRSHTTRITVPRPVDLELRPWPSQRASLEEKAWLERMIAMSTSNPEGPLARGLPGWLIRLGEIEGREGGSWKQRFSRAEELAAGRRDILFILELAKARRALDEERYADAELHEGRAAEHVSGSVDTYQEWESTRGTLGRVSPRRDSGRVSHDAVFAELRVIRAERLLHLGEVEQATSVAESALRLAHASGDLALVSAALGVMASIAEHRGDVLDATARFHELREVARVARDRAAELFALIHLAELAHEVGGARELYLQAQSIMQEEDHEARARACVGLAMHALLAGNPEDGERILTGVAPLSELRSKTRVRALLARGAVATARGHHDAALAAYRMARDEQQQRAVPPSRQDTRIALLLGEAALRAGDTEAAVDAFQRAAEIATVLADSHLVAAAHLGLRRTRMAMGETTDAADNDVTSGRSDRETLAWTSAMHDTTAIQTVKVTELRSPDTINDEELASLESAFIRLDAPGDAPERLDLLDRLARTYARLGRRRDTGMCYARAVWETPASLMHERLETWITSELGSSDAETVGSALDRVLKDKKPPLEDVRLIAAIAAHASEAIAKDPHRIQRWLDEFDGELDARMLWLARLSLSHITGGNPLGLAHTRDRIRVRLASGLSADRELPPFLRLSGRSNVLGNANGEQLSKALEDLAQRIIKTKRRRSSTEAPLAQTNAYIAFQLGHGFARIGKHERARELTANAIKALARVATDPVHKYLIDAFSTRVEQAIAGVVAETPLPDSISAELTNLDRLARFRVDRFREASRILEPFVRPDPFGMFSDRSKDARGHKFAALSKLDDPVARARDIDRLVGLASTNANERERLVVGILEDLLELNEAQAVPILARTWPLIAEINEARRAIRYAEALEVSVHFGRTELVPQLLKLLGVALRVVESANLDEVLHHSLRALRRIGLRNEIAELLAEAEHAILTATAHAGALRARVAFAGGLAFLGDFARALPIFDEARAALSDDFKARREVPKALLTAPTWQLELVRALALAYAQAPLDNALAGIAEISMHFRDITDGLQTNSHFCLSVLHFVESLVLGITSDHLTLGETGRRFIEDDEHLIRRRLHRDLHPS